jgi:iron(III) transport system permease protein
VKSIWTWLSLLCLLILGVFLLYPIANIFYGSLGGWKILFSEVKYAKAVGNSLLLGGVVTLIATSIGVFLAYITARFTFPLKALIAILPLITLVTPEVIVAQTWLMMLGNNGLITRFLGDFGLILPSFYGWFGLITAMSFIYYTYAYIGTLAAIKGFDVSLEEAAQSLGTSPATSRLKVLVPVLLPAVLASSLLIFTMVMGNFALATILGNRVPLLSVLTYQAAVSETASNPVLQSTLASLSIVIVMIVLFFQRWIVSRGRFEMVQGREAIAVKMQGVKGVLLGLIAAIIVIISLMPLFAVIIGAFTAARGPVMRWGQWTTANLERVFNNALQPFINSLTYAAIATFIALILSIIIGYLVVKKRNIITPFLDYLAALPLALSGTALGISLVLAFNVSLSGTAAIIVLAYVVRRLPFGLRNASSTLYNIPNSLEEASISLGVSPFASFIKVVLPLMIPALAGAAVLTWTTTIAELSASIIVYSGGRETMPIQIYKLIDSGLMAQASAFGLILVCTIILPLVIGIKLFKIDLKG